MVAEWSLSDSLLEISIDGVLFLGLSRSESISQWASPENRGTPPKEDKHILNEKVGNSQAQILTLKKWEF